MLPPVTLVRQFDTHRLLPSRHLTHGDSVLAAVANDDEHLQAIFELDAATNDRLLAAQQLLPGIGLEELVFAVPHAAVINAAFCHPNPLGSRFNGPDRGAWYAAFELGTAQAEVAFHKSVHLAEIGRFRDSVTCDDYLADFSAGLHDLRRQTHQARRRGRGSGRAHPQRPASRAFRAALDPNRYVASQALAERLLEAGSLGVVYPSVRRPGGTCLACFRPALVTNVRRGKTYRFTWDGEPTPAIAPES
jgi:RES domain-containing protein